MTDTQTHAPAGAIVHGACGGWWTGANRVHCAACHELFSGNSAAGAHRKGSFGVDRRCVDPATVGLVAREMPFGALWSWPAPEAGMRALRGVEVVA